MQAANSRDGREKTKAGSDSNRVDELIWYEISSKNGDKHDR